MNFRALSIAVVIILSFFFAINVAGLTVINVTVTMDRATFYANESEATAIAELEFTAGAAKNLGDVRFTWFRPDWSIAAVEIDSARNDANASSTIAVDRVGIWHVNATYVNQTDQFDNVSFEVRSGGAVVVVSNMNLELNAPYFEKGERVAATSYLNYSGNVSLLQVVSFTWIDPTSTVVRQIDVLPNSTGVASDGWVSDIDGNPFIVYANYTGDEPISKSATFRVFPPRVKTWHNFSVVVDEVWGAADEPYGVCENITVEAGVTLTIEPGVTVRFCEDTQMTVSGTLISEGTLDSRVNLTAFGFFPPKGYWKGVVINPSSGNSSRISYTNISYASVGLLVSSSSPTIVWSLLGNMSIAGIQLDNATLSIEFSTFNDVGKGISASSSELKMKFNDIRNAVFGVTLWNTNVTLYGDAIFNASSYGIHAVNSTLSASYLNVSSFGGSALRLQLGSSAQMEYSRFESSWYGIDAFSSSFNVAESNLIANDNAVRANDAQGSLVNTSIKSSAGYDFTLEGGSTVFALNCTLNDSKVLVLPASRLLVQYFLDVQVLDEETGNPMANAFVEVFEDGVIRFSDRTPSNGRIRGIPVTDRSFNGSTNATKHVVTVGIRIDGFEVSGGDRTVDMSTSHLETFVASRVVPDLLETISDPLILLLIFIIVIVVAVALVMARRRERKEEPGTAKKPPKPSDIALRDGMGYLVAGENTDLAFDIFCRAIEKGSSGMCITRTYPDEVARTYGLKETPILWLSRDPKRASINPTNLGAIILEVERFLKKDEGKDTIVMLDGLEYLIVQNDFSKVIKFVQNLRDTISVNGSKLLVPFNLIALEESKRALLTRDLEVIE
ncbi:MAG: DUF835 domain-containing protein [Thermoplasmata archaeon]